LGFLDVVLGRKRLKEASREQLFALATAVVTLELELGLKPAGKAAVVFKPLSAGDFVRAENELQELLDVAAESSRSRIRRSSDTFGYEWIVVEDEEFEDLVATVHLVASELQSRGFGSQLLASIFAFADAEGRKVYWIYGYKRGAFWPFVPTGEEQQRDNARELELKAKLERELPIEPDLSRWFAVFDAPL
jgi:GNAT superfamily N-acetyltransferase